ncbi:MAG: PEPxxWA-CTERM sorting domain-containing protein [Sphingopyxis sp.]|nr:PEPxxWA-CTERM sorting domain-containing protein [Sphingopyxis sp.]
MKKLAFATLASVAVIAATPASAATIFTSGFEGPGNSDDLRTAANDPNTPTPNGTWGKYLTADGWTATGPNNPIELQNNVAGAPAPNGGKVFVELDSDRNSSMSRVIGAGTYNLSFLYSARPGRPASTTGIEVLLNGIVFNPPGVVSANGGSNTSWSTYKINNFVAAAGSTLTFRAVGASDSFGGYVDNISLSNAVPEPATWAFMILGFGLIGGAMRQAKSRTTTRLRFA